MCKTNTELLEMIVLKKLLPDEIINKYESEIEVALLKSRRYFYIEYFARLARLTVTQMKEKGLPDSVIKSIVNSSEMPKPPLLVSYSLQQFRSRQFNLTDMSNSTGAKKPNPLNSNNTK